jgi:hypothetical protein
MATASGPLLPKEANISVCDRTPPKIVSARAKDPIIPIAVTVIGSFSEMRKYSVTTRTNDTVIICGVHSNPVIVPSPII